MSGKCGTLANFSFFFLHGSISIDPLRAKEEGREGERRRRDPYTIRLLNTKNSLSSRRYVLLHQPGEFYVPTLTLPF